MGPGERKDERIRVCLDLRYLQRACENSQSGAWGGVATDSANLWNALVRREGRVLVQPLLTQRFVTPSSVVSLKVPMRRVALSAHL